MLFEQGAGHQKQDSMSEPYPARAGLLSEDLARVLP